jgi:hypothetical protein
MKRLITAGAAVILIGLSIGAAVAQPPIPYGPVPEPRVEVVPPPRHGYYWEPGRWHWNGYRYVWFGGRWVAGGPHRGNWLPGHWQWNGHRYIWIPAHWG